MKLREVEMSKYQFMKYAEVRKAEAEQDKNKKKKGKPDKRKKSEDPTKGNLFEDKSSFELTHVCIAVLCFLMKSNVLYLRG